jgi:hypothetical protein
MKVIYLPTDILHFRTNYAGLVLGTLNYEFDRLFDVFGSDEIRHKPLQQVILSLFCRKRI